MRQQQGNDLCSNTLNEFEDSLHFRNGAARQVTWPRSSLASQRCNLLPCPVLPSGFDNMNRPCGGITESASGSRAPAGRGWPTSHGAINSRLLHLATVTASYPAAAVTGKIDVSLAAGISYGYSELSGVESVRKLLSGEQANLWRKGAPRRRSI
jgi:hypothetical protein